MRRCAAIGAWPSAILSVSRHRYEAVHGLTYALALFDRGGNATRPVLQTWFYQLRWLCCPSKILVQADLQLIFETTYGFGQLRHNLWYLLAQIVPRH